VKFEKFDGIAIAAFFLIIAPIGIIGRQAYLYLRFGVWHSLSVVDFLRWLGNKWSTNPTCWTELHNFLDVTPLSLCFVVFGVFVGIAIFVFSLLGAKAQ